MNSVLRLIAQRHHPEPTNPTEPPEPPMWRQHPGQQAVVLDSPHSGVTYPSDFGSCCPMDQLRRAEDTHVEKLYSFAPKLGVSWLEALFPRSYLDLNRSLDDIDPALLAEPWPQALPTDAAHSDKLRLGKGLLWRLTDEGQPIYDRLLSVQEVQRRIARCWVPYHQALADLIEAAWQRHGHCIHINCHSMPSVAASHATAFPGSVHPDMVVGDRDGSTASPAVSRAVVDFLSALGYRVAYNHPYKGVELVRRHGQPERQRHSIQLEVNRRLYMDEATLVPHQGLADLRQDLAALVQALLAINPRTAA
jgi:N-formylglutamate deformylase